MVSSIHAAKQDVRIQNRIHDYDLSGDKLVVVQKSHDHAQPAVLLFFDYLLGHAKHDECLIRLYHGSKIVMWVTNNAEVVGSRL